MYNRRVNRITKRLLPFFVCLVGTAPVLSQTHPATSPRSNPSATDSNATQRAVALVESGQCSEALPLLKRAVRQAGDRDLKKRLGLMGLNCAMTHNAPVDAVDLLTVLIREFPRDPEVLYAATHAYSDLSVRASQDLVREAPFSYQVHMLSAEALEAQGRFPQAVAEYQKIVEINPTLPGIHARIGRALLSGQPTPEAVAQAKKNFEDELQIDPSNAAAEYVLGELAKEDNDLATAIEHYARATKIDRSFAEAYLGWGSALVASQRFSEAIPPLEQYEKLAPDSPSGHFELAMAYNGVGRKDDANREAALQRDAAKALEQVKRRVAEGLERQNPFE